MAIFYKHIKGCGGNSVGDISPTNTRDLWTWIKWSNRSANQKFNSSAKVDVNSLPEIWISTTNSTTDLTESSYVKTAGKILTSKAENQSVETPFSFNLGLYTYSIVLTEADKDDNKKKNIWYKNNILYLDAINNNATNAGTISFNARDFIFKEPTSGASSFTVEPSATFNDNTIIKTNLHVGSKDYDFPSSTSEQGTIKADYKCEAQFFNATSDRRAKTDIKPASFSALSVVQSLPVYSFKYNTNPTPVIGLIAQEAAYHNLDGFNMVDNLLATGENNDFMHMKESKLVYVLWKAVQELSDQVNDLKSQLASLK